LEGELTQSLVEVAWCKTNEESLDSPHYIPQSWHLQNPIRPFVLTTQTFRVFPHPVQTEPFSYGNEIDDKM
jgi:hypothetical protein